MVEDIHKECLLNESTLTLSPDSKLHVYGFVMSYFCDDKVCLSKDLSESDKPSEPIIYLSITKGSKPVEAIPRHLTYTEQEARVNNYKLVTIRYNNDKACTINVT